MKRHDTGLICVSSRRNGGPSQGSSYENAQASIDSDKLPPTPSKRIVAAVGDIVPLESDTWDTLPRRPTFHSTPPSSMLRRPHRDEFWPRAKTGADASFHLFKITTASSSDECTFVCLFSSKRRQQ